MTDLPRAIFLYGDIDRAFGTIRDLKKKWNSESSVYCEWEEYDADGVKGKSSNLDNMLESIACPLLNECHRIFVLKTPNDNIKTKKALIKLIENLPEFITVIVWDTKGLMSGKKQSSPTWTEVAEVFKNNGKAIDSGKSLSDLSDVSKISWIVKIGEDCGLVIPKDCAELLLDLFDCNRAMIQSEIENLSMMCEGTVDRITILENAMPIQKDYPIYKFYSAFNDGSYKLCMSAAQELIERGFKIDTILGFAVKQARWQVVVSDAIRRRKDPKEFVMRISSSDYYKSRKRIESDKSINKRILLQNPSEMKDEDLPKKEKPPSSFAVEEMTRFMMGTLSKLIPQTEKDKRVVIYEQIMKRYVALLDGMYELRTAKGDEKESCFSRILRRVTF